MKSNKKILVISHSLIIDSYRRLFQNISKKKEFNITLLTPLFWKEAGKWQFFKKNNDDKNMKIIRNIPLFLWLSKPLLNLTLIYPSIFYLILKKFDVIHIIEEPYSLTSFLVCLLSRFTNKDAKLLCFSAQNIKKNFPFPFSFFERFVINNCTIMLPLTEDISKVLRAKGSKKIHKIIPLTVNEIEGSKPLRNNLSGNIIRIGFAGRFEEVKGIDLFIDLAESMSNKKLRFYAVGKGSYLENLIQSPSIEYLGHKEHKEMLEFYKNIDILIVPSRTMPNIKEQFGRVVIEAINANSIVICSDSGELKNLVHDKRLIFKENNLKDLKEKLNNALSILKNDSAKDYRIKNRKRILSQYSYKTVANKLISIYKQPK